MWKFNASLSLIVALFVCLGGPAWAQDKPTATVRPSFDCAKADEIETLICQDVELSSDDTTMSKLYAAVRLNALGIGPSNELTEQRLWLKKRDAECSGEAWKKAHSKSQRDCVMARYQSRLNELAVASLFTAHDAALAELIRQSPADASVYEAIYRFTTIEDPNIRAQTVERLIEPTYASLEANSQDSFASLKVPTAHSAVASDRAFGLFVDATVMMADHHITWPCPALVRRPGLVDALGSQWGGSIDGVIPSSNCGAMMPDISDLGDVLRAADDIQPTCEGTIRFSTWRDISKLETAVQLHRSEYWVKEKADAPELEERQFRAKNSEAISKASIALTKYYEAVFKISPLEASRDAETAVDLLINRTFTFCLGPM